MRDFSRVHASPRQKTPRTPKRAHTRVYVRVGISTRRVGVEMGIAEERTYQEMAAYQRALADYRRYLQETGQQEDPTYLRDLAFAYNQSTVGNTEDSSGTGVRGGD